MAKRGDMVEFTNDWHQDYALGDPRYARYGILTKDMPDNAREMEVRTKDGVETAFYIHALGWGGWIPEELEDIYAKEFDSTFCWGYEDEY